MSLVMSLFSKPKAVAPTLMEKVDKVAQTQLKPLVREIDEGLYPEEVMRAMGDAGAYSAHLPTCGVEPDLSNTIRVMSRAGELCTSTAFCMWCQDALGWYIYSSENDDLKASLGAQVASGAVLGGTGLSNPMKTFFGIEKMRLKGEKVPGGYRVKGALPWVSNVDEKGWFGIVFDVEEGGATRRVMAAARGEAEGVKLTLDHDFVAMGGTNTQAVQFRDVFVPEEQILADPIDDYLKRIRAGFVLMQCGMATGMVRSCIELMRQVETQLGHVNKYLEMQPADFEEQLEELEGEIFTLAQTPYDPSPEYFRRVLAARLAGGEASVTAAHYAMLHCGARGYVGRGVAQRRLREAYFVAIVTPATKQLRKMLAELPAA
ncbi:MAG: acyl-CoA/acyl-ACP dehydrogenase [Neomegalonema sp.]|nr:acyl-CoA/acyl-ACP dehydrogenase [Neomegalonema sp.]